MLNQKEKELIETIKKFQELTSKEVYEQIQYKLSYATVKRLLSKLLQNNLIEKKGQGKATKYFISPVYELLQPIDLDSYYEKEIDERTIKKYFSSYLIEKVLQQNNLFTADENLQLDLLQTKFTYNIAQLSESTYNKEMERLAIDLSWKSSQIEGNTYSLLETERLLIEKETASGKTKEEANMLLNHKEAIDFVVAHTDYLIPLSVSKIEDIHSMLIKDLAIDKNIRTRKVGISGTNYTPIDNEFQIREALENMCTLVNSKKNIFEKALLALVLISYIQPFADGNKRTARIVSNAILLNHKYCPLSFRTVDSVSYKKALLIFYEQHNISNFKEIFISQFEFAVNTYF